MDRTLSRRTFHRLALSTGIAGSLPNSIFAIRTEEDFVHPGMLHSHADLIRMRDAVRLKSDPIYGGFERMREHPCSKLSYVPGGASEEIGRNPNVRFGVFDLDANAAYQCSLMWAITGNRSYAKLAIRILNDWSTTLKRITGADAILCASLGGFKMANAAELLRHTEAGWAAPDTERFGELLNMVFLPVIHDFAAFANGNWDTAAIKLMMAIAIYGNDRVLFDRAVNYYSHGCGDGQLAHYIYPNGQCQESGRDQQHTQLGLTHMGDACEMAWQQGLDLYGELENRLLLGFEYTAKYCLDEDVPFVPDLDQTGKYRHKVISERSPLRPGYEQIYNHYVQRRGLAAPWTTKAAEKLRPEGAPFQADATGYGTLLYSRPLGADLPRVPGTTVVYAKCVESVPEVDFVPPAGVARYDILRADRLEGPYRTIGRGVTSPVYRDQSAQGGRTYFYRVGRSLPVAQMAGLPGGWKQSVGTASFNGTAWRLSAGSQWTTVETDAAAGLVARLLMPVASSGARIGLCVDGEPALLIVPASGPPEHPHWSAAAGPVLLELQPPVVSRGRLVGAVWLRLRDGKGAISPDGLSWTEVGPVKTGKRAGLCVSSGIDGVELEASFDQVSVNRT